MHELLPGLLKNAHNKGYVFKVQALLRGSQRDVTVLVLVAIVQRTRPVEKMPHKNSDRNMLCKIPPKNAGYLFNRHDSPTHKKATEDEERPVTQIGSKEDATTKYDGSSATPVRSGLQKMTTNQPRWRCLLLQ